MKLLITADIHMGRIPSVGGLLNLSGTSAWKKIVDSAIEHEVDALILVGDVVDDNELWFSVYGHILMGRTVLKRRGIRVLGVAGNHDSSVFARLSVDFLPHDSWSRGNWSAWSSTGSSWPDGRSPKKPLPKIL